MHAMLYDIKLWVKEHHYLEDRISTEICLLVFAYTLKPNYRVCRKCDKVINAEKYNLTTGFFDPIVWGNILLDRAFTLYRGNCCDHLQPSMTNPLTLK